MANKPKVSLQSFRPPRDLQSKRIWTLGCGADGKAAECFYKTGALKKSLEKTKTPKAEIDRQVNDMRQMLIGTWPATLRRYMQNPKAYPSESVGFISDEIFTIDVDVKDSQPKEIQEQILQDLPPFLKDFVQSNPTFYHRSKSGNGWKIYYFINETVPKKIIPFKHDDVPYGELFFNKFVTAVDPERSDFSNKQIGRTTLASLTELFPELSNVSSSKLSLEPRHKDYKMIIEEVDKLLSIVPPIVDFMVEAAYAKKLKGTSCDSYNHWLNVGFGLAALAVEMSEEYPSIVTELQVKWIKWSQRDPAAFPGVEECEKKFQELYNSTVQAVNSNGWAYFSYDSLRKLMHGFKVPVEDFNAVVKMANGKLVADHTDPENYAQLTAWLNLGVSRDETGNSYITGPVPIIKRFFGRGKKGSLIKMQDDLSVPYKMEFINDQKLRVNMVALARVYGLSRAITSSPVFYGLSAVEVKDIDLIYGWMKSVPWDKTERVMPLIKSTIDIDEAYIPTGFDTDFFYHLIYKHLVIIAGMREKALRVRQERTIPMDKLKKPQGILIFRGGQNCGKSTWIESLIPSSLMSFNEASFKTIKDSLEFKRAIKGLTILSINEVETLFDNYDLAELKNILVQNVDSFRTMNTQNIENNPRTAGVFGTTNQTSIKLDRTGNRRFWIIPVKRCNAIPLLECNYQQFWAELMYKAVNMTADEWNLSAEERFKINEIAKQFSRSTGTAKSIEAVFTEPTGLKKYYTYRTFNFEKLFANMTQKRFRELTNVVLFAKTNKTAFSIVENLSAMRNLTVSEGAFEHDIENWISHTVGKPNESTIYGSRMVFKEGVIKIWVHGRNQDPIDYHILPLKDEFDRLRKVNIKGTKEKVLPDDYFIAPVKDDLRPIMTDDSPLNIEDGDGEDFD